MLPSDADPFELAVQRQSIRLAFVAALQHLPPRQRAALILSEVLGWSAAEIAESLETSVAAINSALQRARTTLESRNVKLSREPLNEEKSELLDRYVDAFRQYDIDALVGLLHEDATLSMPPYTMWLQGPAVIREWLLGPGAPCRGSQLIEVDACGTRAWAQYRSTDGNGNYHAFALIILETSGDRISGWNSFLDVETLFPLFDLPLKMTA